MQIVIKISEADYWVALEQLKEYSDKILDTPINKEIPNTLSDRLLVALFEGTVLPKGHEDLIDRGEVIKSLFDYHNEKKTIGQCIDDVQTIIEADRSE